MIICPGENRNMKDLIIIGQGYACLLSLYVSQSTQPPARREGLRPGGGSQRETEL